VKIFPKIYIALMAIFPISAQQVTIGITEEPAGQIIRVGSSMAGTCVVDGTLRKVNIVGLTPYVASINVDTDGDRDPDTSMSCLLSVRTTPDANDVSFPLAAGEYRMECQVDTALCAPSTICGSDDVCRLE
jgi:hypothetical protein